jgi:hypothetical protein
VDAGSGDAVAGARVRLADLPRETPTDSAGRFAIGGLTARAVVLRVSAAGYRPSDVALTVGAPSDEILVPVERERPRVEETLTVTVDASGTVAEESPLARRLDARELMATASIAASDPLRAIQALPGVAANDELNAGFAARGSGFGAAGLYLDGVRLEVPFHTIRDVNDGYSLTIFNGDVLESVTLVPGGAPARYGDRVGAALAVRTRPGRSDSFHGKATLGAAGAFATVEGPLGGRASWIASARQSYLDYIVERVDDEPHLTLGWRDLTSRLTWRPTPRQTVSLLGLFGRSRYENTETRPSPHEMEDATAGTSLLHVSWRTSSGEHAIGATAFVLRQTGDNRDTDGFPRYSSDAWHSGLVAEAAWRRGSHRLEAGLELRRLREDVLSQRWGEPAPRVLSDFRLVGWPWGAFVQDSWAAPGGRLTLTVGGRIDHLDTTGETVALPRAGLDLALDARTRLHAAVGAYAQFPRFGQLAGENGNPALDAERSRQLVVALERRLPATLRLRVEAYAQQESGLVFNRELEWRLEGGTIVRPSRTAVLRNALSGPSRGVEATLAAAQAGPFYGFVSYGFAHARREDPDGLVFDSDFDQRHTFTAFVRARAGASVVLSTAFRYGGGFPFPGFVRETPEGTFLSQERNLFGPAAYSRWDLRAEKRFTRGRVAASLFVEVANLLDHENERYNEIDSVNPATGRVRLDRDTMLPLLPLFGATVEF